ncbi:MAG: efflux RND transporter permease subunit [Proteobacteria bacterium]|nr:efflux RND transporter permease subunit [Pseudomonadota bacterium]
MKPARFLTFFIQHKTAANLLMVLMMAVGFISLGQLNRQFFPTFDVEIIVVSASWTGATAEDVDANIVQPLEPELRSIANAKNVVARSYEGVASVEIEFEFGTDMQQALADVENAVGQTDFPAEADTPRVIKAEFYDDISTLVISGPYDLKALRRFAKDIKEDLQRVGVDRININGLPDEEIRIEVSQNELARLRLSLNDISAAISRTSLDVPAGSLADGALRVRSLGLLKTADEYANVEIVVRPDGSRIRLGDIARIRETVNTPSVTITRNGNPAVELVFQRGSRSDSLRINRLVQDWLEEYRRTAPESLVIEQYNINADLIQQRISLLVNNGMTGLMLVVGVLFLFLSMRVAIWVAAGIPVAFLATFGVMLFMGQSINMISLFGLIMALGIVVDDAIVIGEHAEHLRQKRGLNMTDAAGLAATRMGPPVVSAMLTTVAAFLPLFTIKGIIGEIISAIPLVVVAVLIASLIEVFFILPAHLAHYGGVAKEKTSGFRHQFDTMFNKFRDERFFGWVRTAVEWRYATLAIAFTALMLSIGMLAGGRVNFVFFTSPEADIAFGNIIMAPGTPRSQTEIMLREVTNAAEEAEYKVTNGEGGLIQMNLAYLGTVVTDGDPTGRGADDGRAGVVIELLTADKRSVRIDDFLAAWRSEITHQPGLQRLTIRAPRGGPPGRDIDIRLMGDDLTVLKAAAQEVVTLVEAVPSATGVNENLSYGAEERIVRLSPYGQALGLSVASVGQQLRASLDGVVVTRFPRGDEEVTVRLSLPTDETLTDNIGGTRIIAPSGQYVVLNEVAGVDDRLGFSVVRRQDGFREVGIVSDLDSDVISTSQALDVVEAGGLREIAEAYDLRYRFAGRDEEESEAFADMGTGGMLALVCMYIILAWVFSSWLLPFAVMVMIPFALIGAVIGHYVMGLTMTILSLFALIALAGIVVNNSIILVATIERRREEGKGDSMHAIVAGASDRLRPVILTSVTTICGLSTLMFERSLQAQFLIPMATTIVFGLATTTLLVLFVVPSVLAIGDDMGRGRRFLWGKVWGHAQRQKQRQKRVASVVK